MLITPPRRAGGDYNQKIYIPKILHRVWLGKAPIPDEYEHYWGRWRALHPGWDLRTWTDDEEEGLYRSGALDASLRPLLPSASERSDWVRYAVLSRCGGVYVDTDVEPARALDPLLPGRRAFAAPHGGGGDADDDIGSAVLGGEPGHPAWAAVLRLSEDYLRRQRDRGLPAHNMRTAFFAHTHVLRYLAEWGTVSLLPRQTFYPYHWRDVGAAPPIESFGPGTFAAHRWGMSWAALPKVSVIIPYGGDARRMEWVLAGLADQSDTEFETIVVNDGKDEGPIKTLIGQFPSLSVRYFLLPPDPGNGYRPGMARNLGIRHARHPVCLFIDQDAVPGRELVREHRRPYLAGMDRILYGKRLRVPEPLVTDYAGDLSAVRACPGVWPDNRTLRGEWRDLPGEEACGQWWTNDASAPTEALRAAGGFDETFRGWGSDDIDLACRLLRRGLTARRVERAEVFHLEHPRLPAAADVEERAWRALRVADWPDVANGGPLTKLEEE